MADSGNGVKLENIALENDSEAMHVDFTPIANYNEEESQNLSDKKTEPSPFASIFKNVSQEKLDQRAQRFGVETSTLRSVSESEVKALYKSLEVDGSKVGKVRLNTIHVRGVDDMNTEDVMEFFKEMPPDTVEWINDYSCNVIWLEPISAARAMLTLSQPVKRSAAERKDEDREEVLIVSEPEEGEDIEMAEQDSVLNRNRYPSMDSDTQQSHSRRNSGDQAGTPVPNNSPVDTSQIDDACSDIGTEVDSSKVDIPLPPGQWRLGHFRKTKPLLMRFAYRSDRKVQGAEKHSQYYLKHGNPNYIGLKGIISTSLKRKMKQECKRPLYNYVDLDAVHDDDDNYQHDNDEDPRSDSSFDYAFEFSRRKEQSKRPRMRMYADDEEEKKRSAAQSLQKGDLRTTIGSVSKAPSIPYYENDSGDLRSKIGSRPARNLHDRISSSSSATTSSSSSSFNRDLSKPIVIGDLRSKLEQLRQARQPKVPLLIEVSPDDV